MAGGERAPAVLEAMGVAAGRADGDVDGDIGRCILGRDAAVEKVWTRPTDCVLDDVRDQGGEDYSNDEGKVGSLMLGWRGATDHIDG